MIKEVSSIIFTNIESPLFQRDDIISFNFCEFRSLENTPQEIKGKSFFGCIFTCSFTVDVTFINCSFKYCLFIDYQNYQTLNLVNCEVGNSNIKLEEGLIVEQSDPEIEKAITVFNELRIMIDVNPITIPPRLESFFESTGQANSWNYFLIHLLRHSDDMVRYNIVLLYSKHFHENLEVNEEQENVLIHFLSFYTNPPCSSDIYVKFLEPAIGPYKHYVPSVSVFQRVWNFVEVPQEQLVILALTLTNYWAWKVDFLNQVNPLLAVEKLKHDNLTIQKLAADVIIDLYPENPELLSTEIRNVAHALLDEGVKPKIRTVLILLSVLNEEAIFNSIKDKLLICLNREYDDLKFRRTLLFVVYGFSIRELDFSFFLAHPPDRDYHYYRFEVDHEHLKEELLASVPQTEAHSDIERWLILLSVYNIPSLQAYIYRYITHSEDSISALALKDGRQLICTHSAIRP